MNMARKGSLRGVITLLLLVLATLSVAQTQAQDSVFRVLHSVEEVEESIENARHIAAVVLLSTASDEKLRQLTLQNEGTGDDAALVKAIEAQFPHVKKIARSFDGAVEFVVADIPDTKTIQKKWNIATFPALVIYTDAPKKNPYTGKTYRQSTLTPMTLLSQPRELKKLLRESIPSTYVTEWNSENGFSTLADAQKKWTSQKEDKLVVLVSKQPSASPLFKALSVEFESRGLAFAYVNHEEPIAEEIKSQWGVEKVPALVVVTGKKTLDERVVLQDDSQMKAFADLKSFIEPFAMATGDDAAKKRKAADAKKKEEVPFLTKDNFDVQVTQSKLVWILSLMDAEAEAAIDKKAWRKLMGDIQKKSGIVALGAVSCTKDPELCEEYGGAGAVRVLPIRQDPATGEVERDEILEEVFTSVEDARQPAADSLPGVVPVMGSSAELNAFVSRAMATKAMPVVLVTTKKESSPILKALALSFPSQNIAVGVVSDEDPQIRHQFSLTPSAKTSFLCLVAVDKEQMKDQPANTAPFGIIAYDKKTMGPLNYANMVRYLMSVLQQYPHPKDAATTADAAPSDFISADEVQLESDGLVTVPYLRKDNIDSLCGGNKICAIGFFEGHIDTLSDEESPLAKSVAVLREVATKSKKARQPFAFMWTNGKCQSAFAESFGVGAFQMPTVVVYSPSKGRYATNVGVFDEENASAFLRSVLTGKIATAPLNQVGEWRDECSLEEISVDVNAAAEAETDEDLGDLLSEIIGDEENQRRQLEEELAKERKASKTKGEGKSKKSKTKKKKGKKGKKKNSDDHDEL